MVFGEKQKTSGRHCFLVGHCFLVTSKQTKTLHSECCKSRSTSAHEHVSPFHVSFKLWSLWILCSGLERTIEWKQKTDCRNPIMLNQDQICACWIWHNGFGVRSQQCYNGATVWMPTPRPPLAASLPQHLLLRVSLRPYAASIHGCAQIRKHTCICVGRSANIHAGVQIRRRSWNFLSISWPVVAKHCWGWCTRSYVLRARCKHKCPGNVQSPAEYESQLRGALFLILRPRPPHHTHTPLNQESLWQHQQTENGWVLLDLDHEASNWT